jgi:two-component system chemotaxis response regulator CheB
MGTRVLVIDDTVVFRRIVSEVLAAMPGVEVVGTASNGRTGLARIAALKPDLVTLDIDMPEMSGLEVLQALSGADPKPGVVILSSLTIRGGEMTIRALESGAFDFVSKPQEGSPEENLGVLRSRLARTIRSFEARRNIRTILNGSQPQVPASRLMVPLPAPVSPEARRPQQKGSPIILIGVSTGGPQALATVLPALPPDLGAPLFIVQHMPSLFTKPLAASLDAKCAIRVKEAEDGEIAVRNRVYLAPGGRQMKLVPGRLSEIVIRVTGDPPENNCRPAVDYLFRSAALNFPGRAVAVILTGMGNDGTAGLRMLKRSGCTSIAQDEASCVVFGMPKEAIAAGVVDTVAPLDQIAPMIVFSVREAYA